MSSNIRTTKNSILLSCLVTIIFVVSGLRVAYCQNALSLGGERWGIAFGNPVRYSVIRLNIYDTYESDVINGLNFSLYSTTKQSNGIRISLISDDVCPGPVDYDERFRLATNGLKISVLNLNGVQNGLQIGACNYCLNYKGNGLLIGIVNTHMYGNKCMCYARNDGVTAGVVNAGLNTVGVQIGGFNFWTSSSVSVGIINIERTSWFQIGLLNYIKEGPGVQIGIINIRKNNIRFARMLPLLNLRWESRELPNY